MTQIYTILFDLDGAIVHTAPDLMNAHNHVMKKFGYEAKELLDLKKLAGKGAWMMMQRSFKKEVTDEKIKKEMTKEFIDYYSKNIDNSSKPILGINKFLDWAKSKIGKNSKVSHLSYVGDASVGQNSNIGAGTITCNYDGVNKHKTKISDNVFIGSNTSLVAPIKIDKNSTVGAGSVITRNVKKNSLALTRSKQQEVKNYKRKK